MKRKQNMIAGLCFFGFGVLAVFVLIPFGIAQPDSVKYRALSPTFWPYIVCSAIGVVGALLLINEFSALIANKEREVSAADAVERSAAQPWRLAAVLVLLLATYSSLEFLGFVLTLTLGLFALMLLAGERRLRIMLPISLLLPFALHIFFVKAAQRPIPGGILDFLLYRI